MATDPAHRPSRRGWPLHTAETTTPAGTHSHKLPQGIFRLLIALGVFLLILAVADAVLVLYIVGRGQVREQQIEQTRRDVREQLCDVLDGLPQGGVLDLTRDKLGCGPGLPLSSFSPEIQKDLSPAEPDTHEPGAPADSTAGEPTPVVPAEPSAAPEPPPVADTPASPPGGAQGPGQGEPPPLSPPSQIRELVCDLLPICPKETS